jgi:tRNA(fMet)-specific endonuclease VapC
VIYVLDTNILIYLIKNQPPAIAQRVDALPEDARLCMSFVTWAELLKGAGAVSGRPAICEHYAEQFARLKDAGTPIGANDLWIACHALAESATLVTHNTSEFLRVRGLKVEDWVAPA